VHDGQDFRHLVQYHRDRNGDGQDQVLAFQLGKPHVVVLLLSPGVALATLRVGPRIVKVFDNLPPDPGVCYDDGLMNRFRPRGAGCSAVAVLACALAPLAGCGQEGASVGFVLLRAEDLRPGSLAPRTAGLDREYVREATCQILNSELGTVASETFDVDPESTPGEQEARLTGVPAGSGFFARILGLDDSREVHECGVTGPFNLGGGKEHWITIVIQPPPNGDPYCQAVCATDEGCPSGAYCPSPCASGDDSGACVRALCLPYAVGAPCSGTECGADLSCVLPGYGYQDGYCTKSCEVDGDCPRGVDWSSSCCPGTVAGLGHAVCTLDCTVDADCRQGYRCTSFPVDKLGCLPE
jgi:hypothetical protein